MGTNFDDERKILDFMHGLNKSDCFILSDRNEGSSYFLRTADIVQSLIEEGRQPEWLNNTKSQEPPDFINEKEKLMMEVMRFDDHSKDGRNNPVLVKEKQMNKEIESLKNIFPNAKMAFSNPVTDLSTDEDHNYHNFYTGFQRTVKKHVSKIAKYRVYHPNKELAFLVMNEASGIYFESVDGKSTVGKLHLPFFDNRFLDAFKNEDLDYLLLFSPFNHFETTNGLIELPKLVAIDVKHFKDNPDMKYINYDEKRMKSNER